MERFTRRLLTALLPVLLLAAGCSNLTVKKVPLSDRVCGTDDQQGFRYYLNRPYLLVKKPIVIGEVRSLVKKDVRGIFVHAAGPRVNEPIDVRPTTSGSQAAALTLAELRNGGAALADTGAQSSDQASLTQPAVKGPAHTPALSGDMEILYLPDLDEQYVVKSKNLIAKSAFGLTFKDGSELTQVDGEHDSTTVTLSLLDQVQNAIGQAQSVEQERIKHDAREAEKIESDGGKAAKMAYLGLEGAVDSGSQPLWQQIERTTIKPGLYRLNKPWETEGPGVEALGSGLLAKLGLPVDINYDYEPIGVLVKK